MNETQTLIDADGASCRVPWRCPGAPAHNCTSSSASSVVHWGN